ncbi:MAG: hypothetical protein ACK55Z_05205, partial [bacterium]
ISVRHADGSPGNHHQGAGIRSELAKSGYETRNLEREGEDDRLGELHAEGGPQPTGKLSTL